MKVVSVHEAKTHLSRLIESVLAGEEVIITRRDQPVVRLLAVEPERKSRAFGTAKGIVEIADDFDAPVPDFDDYR
jgi:prevent-host-death family protein